MSGHSRWHQIKHKKEASDQERGKRFSKLLRAIAAAAHGESNPQFNPRLRDAVQSARSANVPGETIERAIKKSGGERELEELVVEAYGPEKAALVIEAITDNRNRTIAEIRHLLEEHGAKMAEPGSVRWAFEMPAAAGDAWRAKFAQSVTEDGRNKLAVLVAALEEHNDVQKVWTNANL